MGLFDLFKKKPSQVDNLSPMDKLNNQMFSCFDIVFKREIENVSGISPSDKLDIFKIISKSDGGFMNMGAYHSQVYDTYFKDKHWEWAEYEKWNDRFTKLGRFPTAFKPKIDLSNIETILELLSVAELKDVLKSNNIEFSSKLKKPDLINLVKEIPNIKNNDVIQSKLDDKLEKERFGIYTILMRTISFRSKGLSDYKRAKDAGVKEFKVMHTFEADKEFAQIALKENPNAIPPFYPYDLCMLQSVVNFDF